MRRAYEELGYCRLLCQSLVLGYQTKVADQVLVAAAQRNQAALREVRHENFSGGERSGTFCAEELRRAGRDARVTMQSRDQGVDVVAEKNRVRVVWSPASPLSRS